MSWQQTEFGCTESWIHVVFSNYSNQLEKYLFVMDEVSELIREEGKTNRLADFKKRSIISDQETRRIQLLSDQKRRREKTFNDFRNAELLSSLDYDDDDEVQEEVMEWSESKPKQPRLKDMFMLSEWMASLPENFEEKWMFVLCPVGKRCLVRCSKGSTSVYGKRGQRLAKFQSAFPNGGQRDGSGCRYSNSEVTILDCIWNSQSKCYFILDLLSWKGQLYMDTEMSFRAFWIKSKVEEMPRLSERSERNTYPFIPLEYNPCDLATISSTISRHPHFPLDEPKVDGILFYHSEAYYTPGTTPLVLWLKPFMLPEILNMTIPDCYEYMKPPSYVDKEHFIMDYEARKKTKRRRRKKGNKIEKMDEETEEPVTDCNMLEE